ncbi:MAG: glycerol kinase GlpK [Gemmatimonadetes bacterium]|nr:glycerol kinase GlpK [Gemmatimonadota bacterium]NNK48526.1 glycerol kinase GlpK [Gemmatimonadota bacterium]
MSQQRNLVLAIDQGTTGSRALVVDRDGRILGTSYREFRQSFPEPGWVEHDAEEIWASVRDTTSEALTAAGAPPERLAAIGITNQRETTVVWDRASGRPLAPAIVWQDRRTSERCQELTRLGHGPGIRSRTGLVLDPYFSGTKLEWLLNGNPGWRERAASGDLAFGTIDSWLIFRLTGSRVHATDHTNASRTMLYSLETGDWDPWLCELFGVPGAMLPDVRNSSGDFGVTDPELFGAEVPILGVAGDQQAALFGQGCWERGEAKNTYGTGSFLLLHTGKERGPDVEGVLTTSACDRRGGRAFAYEGAVLVAGAAIQWLRDGLGLLEDAADSESMARSVESAEGVVFVPALTGLGTPWWEPDARGTIVGLTRGTRKEHLVRAALEAMAYSTVDALQAMTTSPDLDLQSLKADGGAAANDWLMQFQADVLGVSVRRPAATELTALGVAGLAGLKAGVWAEPEEFLAARGSEDQFGPDPQGSTMRQAGVRGWRRAVRTAIHWAEIEDAEQGKP